MSLTIVVRAALLNAENKNANTPSATVAQSKSYRLEPSVSQPSLTVVGCFLPLHYIHYIMTAT